MARRWHAVRQIHSPPRRIYLVYCIKLYINKKLPACYNTRSIKPRCYWDLAPSRSHATAGCWHITFCIAEIYIAEWYLLSVLHKIVNKNLPACCITRSIAARCHWGLAPSRSHATDASLKAERQHISYCIPEICISEWCIYIGLHKRFNTRMKNGYMYSYLYNGIPKILGSRVVTSF